MKAEYEKARFEIANIHRAVEQAKQEKDSEAAEERLRILKVTMPVILQEANEELCDDKGVIVPWASFSDTHTHVHGADGINDDWEEEHTVEGINTSLEIPSVGNIYVFLTRGNFYISTRKPFCDQWGSSRFDLLHLNPLGADQDANEARKMIIEKIVNLHREKPYTKQKLPLTNPTRVQNIQIHRFGTLKESDMSLESPKTFDNPLLQEPDEQVNGQDSDSAGGRR